MERRLKAYKKTVSIVNETAVQLYENLGNEKIGFLMESYDKNNGRFTFMGIDPEEIIQSKGNSIVITDMEGEEKIIEGNPLTILKDYYSSFHISKENGEFVFMGGLVGSLGYDFIRYSEELPNANSDEIGIETIQLMLAVKFLVIDHVAETLTAVILKDSQESREQALLEADELIKLALGSKNKKKEAYNRTQKKENGIIVKQSDNIEQYSEKVNKIKNYIKEGHIFQTVLSQRWTIKTEQDGFTLYKKLRELNPSPYLYYFHFRDFEIIGSSPEMIVKQTDQKVYTCPIAGSRKRGKTEKEDQEFIDELLADEKERAEHVMLVDLARNDMGKISEFGTVKVTQFMDVQKYSHIMHIVSMVEGKKKGKYHPFDLVASFLPAGTLSGAPKIRAMEIIDELEESKRGLYGGATGYIDFNGNMDFCITIRTMIKKGKLVYLQAGAGIVADSIAKNEYMECCSKVMALAKTLMETEDL